MQQAQQASAATSRHTVSSHQPQAATILAVQTSSSRHTKDQPPAATSNTNSSSHRPQAATNLAVQTSISRHTKDQQGPRTQQGPRKLRCSTRSLHPALVWSTGWLLECHLLSMSTNCSPCCTAWLSRHQSILRGHSWGSTTLSRKST